MSKGSKAKWGWGNWIGYIVLPLSIALQDDPLDYIRIAKARIDRKKLSLAAISTCMAARLVEKTLGPQVAAAIAHKTLLNTTLALSNMVGPLEEISLYGHPMAYLAPSVYGHPQAVTVHFQSYCNKMTIALAADPEVIPDPHSLLDGLEESLNAMRKALVARGPNAA
uniref:O-acyltransferase WSD1 C-terminal domain-containing protein n=1 Tax=Rhizophora mucronata TaxID=61149 RepID=A0A2P2IUP9_RHIMU